MKRNTVFIALLTPLVLHAQQFSINSFVVGNGGGKSTGGNYTLTGTIAQHSAGDAMNGNKWAFSPGFWAIQTPGAPTLGLALSGPTQLTISWSPPMPGWILQETTNLNSGSWANSASGTTNPITIPTTGSNKFFRLAKP